MTFVLLCAWGVCVFLAFLGYGELLFRVLRIEGSPWPVRAALGVSLLVAAGGVLNLYGLVRPLVLICLVVAGDFLFGILCWSTLRRIPVQMRTGYERVRRKPVSLCLAALLIVCIAVPVFGNVQVDTRTFNFYDDLPAYLTLPFQTLQLGSLPFDPFNERRVTSCLGAPYLLQNFMMVFGGVRSIRFVDVSMGMIIFAGALLAIFRALGLSLNQRLCLTLLIFCIPVDRLNTTLVVLPAALFCSLFLIQMDSRFNGGGIVRRPLLLGLVAACLCCLKSTYLPAAILICGLFFAGRWLMKWRLRSLIEGVAWGAITLCVLLPWMIDMHHKEATYLFPILGRGYDASAYGVIPLPNGLRGEVTSAARWVWITVLPTAGPLLLACIAGLVAYRQKREPKWVVPLCALLLGSALAIASIASSTGGEAMERYSLPFQLPALLVFVAFVMRWGQQGTPLPNWLKASGAMVALTLVVLAYVSGIRHLQYRNFLEDARLLTPRDESWFDPTAETRRIEALQAQTPPGERILARLFVTYPFDFQRNPVFVADYTGMAGLPLGCR